jgi:predicted RNA binding protein YcfA (HicA-like mRNA interferase family)
MSSTEVIKRLVEAGFIHVSTKGDHWKFKHPDGRITIVTHPVKDIPKGTLGNIRRQSKLTLR